jgi:uncharacterized protein YceH (UPF0502 family)
MFTSHHQNAGQYDHIKVVNKAFKNSAKMIYMGKAEAYQNTFMKKLRADHFQERLATINFRILSLPISYLKLIVLVVLGGCETWSPKLRDEHRMKVFDNMVQRTFELMKKEAKGG